MIRYVVLQFKVIGFITVCLLFYIDMLTNSYYFNIYKLLHTKQTIILLKIIKNLKYHYCFNIFDEKLQMHELNKTYLK